MMSATRGERWVLIVMVMARCSLRRFWEVVQQVLHNESPSGANACVRVVLPLCISSQHTLRVPTCQGYGRSQRYLSECLGSLTSAPSGGGSNDAPPPMLTGAYPLP